MERTTAEGVLIKPGHQGGIYKAFNGAFVGYSGKRTLTLAPDGRVVSDRMLSKLRLGETGADYAYRTLVALGAPRRSPGEGDAEYVARARRPIADEERADRQEHYDAVMVRAAKYRKIHTRDAGQEHDVGVVVARGVVAYYRPMRAQRDGEPDVVPLPAEAVRRTFSEGMQRALWGCVA